MKRVIVALVFVVVLTSVLISCSKQTCPAYSYNTETTQVENIN